MEVDVAVFVTHQEDQFVYQTLQRALYLDSFSNSHPIQVMVSDPSQINEIFDQISYDKVGKGNLPCVCVCV